MLILKTTAQFRKDYKWEKKRGRKPVLLREVIDALLTETPLDAKYKDHALGEYEGFRECHIQPNWLLVYIIKNGMLILTHSRTGSHEDLFR